MAARIVKHTLEIIHLLTDQNPVQVSISIFFFLEVIPLFSGHQSLHLNASLSFVIPVFLDMSPYTLVLIFFVIAVFWTSVLAR